MGIMCFKLLIMQIIQILLYSGVWLFTTYPDPYSVTTGIVQPCECPINLPTPSVNEPVVGTIVLVRLEDNKGHFCGVLLEVK